MARALQFSWFKWAKRLPVREIRIKFRLGRGGEALLSKPSALATNTALRDRNDEPDRAQAFAWRSLVPMQPVPDDWPESAQFSIECR